MSQLHPVFNVINLTLALDDPIQGRHPPPPPLPEIIDGEEEWVVEEILDSKIINWKLCYLVKWQGYGIEHNSWEPWDNLHTLELVTDFHQKFPRAPWQICFADFNTITFHPISPAVLGCHSLEGGVDVRGHLHQPTFPTEYPNHNPLNIFCPDKPPYIPPHH